MSAALAVPIGIALLLGAGAYYASMPSAFDRAQEEYDFLKKNGADQAQICAAARKVRDAARDSRNAKDFQLWDLLASVDCNRLAIDRL